MPWAVAITRPRYETKVTPHLERQGMEYFLPKIKVRTHGLNYRLEPLFPRYFFCLVGTAWHELMTTVGITGVIMNGERPALVPDPVVNELKARCDHLGVYIPPPKLRFRRGMSVRIKCGLLEGKCGIVQGMRGKERVAILLDILGGANVRATFFEGDLSLVT